MAGYVRPRNRASRLMRALLSRRGSLPVLIVAASAALTTGCDRGPAHVADSATPAAVLPAATVEAAAPAPAVEPSPLPVQAQEVGVVAALGDEGWLAVVRAEGTPGAETRLLLAFQIARPGWTSDAAPAAIARIYLTDERGGRVPLLTVTGSSATDDSSSMSLEGWYTFGPLAPGARRVSLTYPVYEDGSHPQTVAFDLGNASPPLTQTVLGGIWRTALVSAPSPPSGQRREAPAAWDYERVEFLADGRLRLSGAGSAQARQGTYDSPNGTHLSITLTDGARFAYSVDELTAERLVLARSGPAGTEWVVLTKQ